MFRKVYSQWKVGHCYAPCFPAQDMATLRDYIAFARMHVHPELSEEAAQSLVQAYVGQWPMCDFAVVRQCMSYCEMAGVTDSC